MLASRILRISLARATRRSWSRDAYVPWDWDVAAGFAPGFAFVGAGRVAVAVRAELLGADDEVRGADTTDGDGLGAVGVTALAPGVMAVSGVADAVSTPVTLGARTSATF